MSEESKDRQILNTIKCGATECGECGDRQVGQFDALECSYGMLSAPWSVSVDQLKSSKWMDTKRLPQCLIDEAKAKEQADRLHELEEECTRWKLKHQELKLMLITEVNKK